MSKVEQRLTGRIQAQTARGLYRSRLARAGSPVSPQIEGRGCINFAGNDYLGLAADRRVIEAMSLGAQRYGAGAGASELVSGHTEAHARLEEELAAFTGRPRALVFSTGYMANLSVIGVLAGRGDCVIEDRLNHASLIDAATLSHARLLRYAHRDAEAMRACLAHATRGSRVVVTDGVFSMDGDLAPLPDLAAACAEHDAALVIDDAHGLGVLGDHGGGTLEHFGLNASQAPVLVGMFGKALGVFGAFVAGSEAVIEALIQFARPYAYTTALPPAVAEAVRAAVRIVREEPQRRRRLRQIIDHFRNAARAVDLRVADSPTAIQPLIVGDAARAADISAALRERGYWVPAIRPPTVPAGTARLRVSLSAVHTETQIDGLLAELKSLLCTGPR